MEHVPHRPQCRLWIIQVFQYFAKNHFAKSTAVCDDVLPFEGKDILMQTVYWMAEEPE